MISILLHAGALYIMATGLPGFSRDFPTPEHPVPVEIKTIDDVTRVKEPEVKPEPEKEQPKTQAAPLATTAPDCLPLERTAQPLPWRSAKRVKVG